MGRSLYGRQEYEAMLARSELKAKALADYYRFAQGYKALGATDPDNVVGLAMIGFDMGKARDRVLSLGEPVELPAFLAPKEVPADGEQAGASDISAMTARR